MPLAKRRIRTRGRRGYRKARDKKTYIIAKSAARVVMNKQLEKHFFDTNASIGIGAAGSILGLSGVPQSAGASSDSTREGDRITIKSLQIRGLCASAADQYNTLRVVIFQYLSNEAAAVPTAGQVLENAYVGTVYAPHAPYAKDYAGYTIIPLYDKVMTVNYGATGDAGPQVKTFKIKLTARDFKGKAKPFIQFIAGGTTASTGSLWMAVYSDSTLITHPSFYYVSRLRFISN